VEVHPIEFGLIIDISIYSAAWKTASLLSERSIV
jgi:hypothetical protein